MYGRMREHLQRQLDEIRQAGLFKAERVLSTPQNARVGVAGGRQVLNLCANNYLGLAQHPQVIAAAHRGLDQWGYGLASVRFICGTQAIHKSLEQSLSTFLGTDDTILYSSCFDANGGLFETLLDAEDAVISDELNHASIIDGIRLCKAQRRRYKHADMADLETGLKEAAGSRFRLISTDGVFSMDGDLAKLPEICDLAERHEAMVMVDDSHATGILDRTGAARQKSWVCSSASTSSPARSARRSAARSAASPQGRSRSSSTCGSAHGPISSQTRCRPPCAWRESRPLSSSPAAPSCARACTRMLAIFGRDWNQPDSPSSPVDIRLFP